MIRKQYKSYSRAVIAAVNDYFRRLERLADDPYLETREKEDAFIQEIRKTIRQELHAAASVYGLLQLLRGVPLTAAPAERGDMLDATMDFVDSF